MKNLALAISFVLCLGFWTSAQQLQEVSSTIKRVTVFSNEAQIEREATLNIEPGNWEIRLTGLSPYVKQESIRIGGNGSFTINNVGFQRDHLAQLEGTAESKKLKEKIEALELKIEDEKLLVEILNQRIAFLNANRTLTSNERSIRPEEFRQFVDFYGSSIEKLMLEKHQKARMIEKMEEEQEVLEDQLDDLSGKTDRPSGTILLSINANTSSTVNLSFSYLVSRARWFPSYDIRFNGIGQPISITFKASVSQDTGINWEDVDLKLSTAQTNVGAEIPELETFWLDFRPVELHEVLQGRAAGLQLSGTPGASDGVRIRGVGSVAASNTPLYVIDGVVYENANHLDPSRIKDISVLRDASATAIYGNRASSGVVIITTKDGDGAGAPLSVRVQNETSVEFLIDAPQTIISNNKPNVIAFKEESVEATFEYRAIPKLSNSVFLVANVVDWFDAGLMDGQANIYFENTFTGKSTVNTRNVSDTLKLSFGVDNAISIRREKTRDFTSRRFLGSNQTDILGFRITVRNNKPIPVVVKVEDQIPVSTTRDIQVEATQLSGGRLNQETGKVDWDVSLNPGESKELILQYSVRYPRNRLVDLE